MKRLAELLNSAKRFKPSYKFCTSFLPSLFVPVGSLLSARRYIYVKLSWGLNYPSPLWLEELHAIAKPSPCNGWQYATRPEERNSPVREANTRVSPGCQRRALTTRAPRALTFSVKVDSEPGASRWPSIRTGISIGMRLSAL